MVSTQTSLTCRRSDNLLPQSLLYNIISSKLAEAFTLTTLHAQLNDYQDNLAFLKREPNQPSYQFTCNFPNKPHLDLVLPSNLEQQSSNNQGWISTNTYLHRKRQRLHSSIIIRCPNCRLTFRSRRSLKYHMQRCRNMVYNKPLTTVSQLQSVKSENPSFPSEVQSTVVSANAIKEAVGLSKCPFEYKSGEGLSHQTTQRRPNMGHKKPSATPSQLDDSKLISDRTVKSPLNDHISKGVNTQNTQELPFRVGKLLDHEKLISEEKHGTLGSSEQVMVAYLVKSGNSTVPDNVVEKPYGKSKRIETSIEPQKKRKLLILNNVKSFKRLNAYETPHATANKTYPVNKVNGNGCDSTINKPSNETISSIEKKVASKAGIIDHISNAAEQKELKHDNINTESSESSSKQTKNDIGHPEENEFDKLPKFESIISNKPPAEVGDQLLNKPDIPDFAADVSMGMEIARNDQTLIKISETSCRNYQSDVKISMENSTQKPCDEDEEEPDKDSIRSSSKKEQRSNVSECDNVSITSCLTDNCKSFLPKTNPTNTCTTRVLVQTENIESDSHNDTNSKNPPMSNVKTKVEPSKEKAADQSSTMQDEHKRTKNAAETCSKQITHSVGQHKGMKGTIFRRGKRTHTGKKPFKNGQCSSTSTVRWDLWRKLDRLESLVLGQSRDSENITEKLAAVETQIKIMYLEGASCPTDRRCQTKAHVAPALEGQAVGSNTKSLAPTSPEDQAVGPNTNPLAQKSPKHHSVGSNTKPLAQTSPKDHSVGSNAKPLASRSLEDRAVGSNTKPVTRRLKCHPIYSADKANADIMEEIEKNVTLNHHKLTEYLRSRQAVPTVAP